MLRVAFGSWVRASLTGLAALTGIKSPAASSAIVAGIDHLYVSTAQARALHSTLRDSLGLPEAWEFADHGAMKSGGISLGNVVLEFMAVPAAAGASIDGLALLPNGTIEGAQAKLRAAGLDHARPVRTNSNGEAGWILMGLADFPEANVFLCEYLDAATVQRNRDRGTQSLAAAAGGAIGVVRVSEVVIGARNPATQRARWRALAGTQADGDLITFARGPDVRIVPAERDAVLELVAVVHDPQQATKAWPQSCRSLPVRFVAK